MDAMYQQSKFSGDRRQVGKQLRQKEHANRDSIGANRHRKRLDISLERHSKKRQSNSQRKPPLVVDEDAVVTIPSSKATVTPVPPQQGGAYCTVATPALCVTYGTPYTSRDAYNGCVNLLFGTAKRKPSGAYRYRPSVSAVEAAAQKARHRRAGRPGSEIHRKMPRLSTLCHLPGSYLVESDPELLDDAEQVDLEHDQREMEAQFQSMRLPASSPSATGPDAELADLDFVVVGFEDLDLEAPHASTSSSASTIQGEGACLREAHEEAGSVGVFGSPSASSPLVVDLEQLLALARHKQPSKRECERQQRRKDKQQLQAALDDKQPGGRYVIV